MSAAGAIGAVSPDDGHGDGPGEGLAPDRLSPLDAEHVALGATMTSFAGWRMPLRYAGDLAEHHAVRRQAGLFDLSHMGEIAVRGPQASAALDHALVGDLGAVPVGRARYTMMTSPDGGIVDDLVVYRLDRDEYLVVANASNADVVLTGLTERSRGFDADVAEEFGTALIAVQGPAALTVLSRLTAVDPGLRNYAWTRAVVAGVEVLLARTGYTGEDGVELFLAPADAPLAPVVWRALLEAGHDLGLVPAGLSCRDSLRLEAGMPLYGHELDLGTTPYDAGLGRVVRLDKTGADGAPLDFVGRAALERRAAQVEGTRALVGLRGAGRRPARAGYAVLGPSGEPVGTVTSGLPSPTLGVPLAMAYVPQELSATGTELAVDVRGRGEPFVVVDLPFYRR